MKIRPFHRIALFFLFILIAPIAVAQREATDTNADKPADAKLDVIYTGRLLGYFRVPSLQKFNEVNGCPDEAHLNPSKAAKQFLAVRDTQSTDKTILVGTGDNFAPELEARVFSNVPAGLPGTNPNEYIIGNKELYWGSNERWVFYKEDTPFSRALRVTMAAGKGTIPNDNVACFLRRAQYAAVVPGKHDFYFGAERVRQFARFLARDGSGKYEPVQMLGANLVMETEPIESKPVSAKVKKEHTFVDWPSAYPILNLTDGKSVYPWFSVLKIQLAEIPSEAPYLKELKVLARTDGILSLSNLTGVIGAHSGMLARDLLSATSKSDIERMKAEQKRLSDLTANYQATQDLNQIRICSTNGDPNDLANSTCNNPKSSEIRMDGNKVVLYAYLKPVFSGPVNYSTLEYGKNHFVCRRGTNEKTKQPEDGCIRFKVYTPFFAFPHKAPNEVNDGYNDPEPYTIKNNVAIFGVVDPILSEQVGILNLGWKHSDDPELTSHVSAEDPADALTQQLEYFAIKYPHFSGMKVLLAQMPPQKARALAARFPEFQIVVAAADKEQATSTVTMSTTWTGEANDTFLAVPTPYFDPSTRKGKVHYGTINATQQNKEWNLSAKAFAGDPVEQEEDKAEAFWARIKQLPGCLQSGFPRKPDEESYGNQTYLKWLTLCAMQQHLGTDVALIQTRDLFDQIPVLDPELHTREAYGKGAAESNLNVQQTLDRLIWKSDLITLLYIPGSALKKALDKSEEYEAAESATLLLSVERGRKLETLGIQKQKDEYFINELPLDSNRLYAVATTDYIGAGDTGYPDLVNAARNPRTHPAAYTQELISISSLVCRKYFSDNPSSIPKYCLGSVDGNSYLDETTAKQIPPYDDESRFSRFQTASGLAWIKKRTPSSDPADGLEHRVQRRSFRVLSLRDLSIGFTDLDNNRTDESLQDKFAGVTASGVDSKENRDISASLDIRYSYFADKFEYFLGVGADYDRETTGDPTLATGVSFNKNRLFFDGGLVWWRRPGRELPNFGPVVSLRLETQPEHPFSAFNLNTPDKEQIRIEQKRGLLLLGRVGVRWQNRTNAAEFGGQYGREFRALRGYHFENPDDNDPECLVNAAQTLSDCIAAKSLPAAGMILPTSTPSALLEGRPRAGIYFNHIFSFPIWSKMKYEAKQDADFFFVKFHEDTTIDTRFRYNSKNSLLFTIWPNFSIGPTMELFMYQNKVNGNFLFQRQFGIVTKINFDIINRREKKSQVKSRE